MKISTITCALFGSVLLSASGVLAGNKKFKSPPADSTYSPGETIRFETRDPPDSDKDSTVVATLYSDNGEPVKVIKEFYGEHDDDRLEFFYDIDHNLVDGRYYVELSSDNNPDDTASSYIFNVVSDEYPYPMGYMGDPQFVNYNPNPGYPF